MTETPASFINTAYTYFPKGVSDEDENYASTPEHRHLIKTLNQNQHLDKNWKALLKELKKDCVCQFIGVPDRIERGFRIAIIVAKPERHYVVINISKLTPYYCFYTKSGQENVTVSEPGFLTFSDFASQDREVINKASEKIKTFFEGYKEFPSNLIHIELKDVEYEDKGELVANLFKRSNPIPMTLFRAFFSTNIFY